MKATGCKQSTQARRQAARANQIKTSNEDAQQHRQNLLAVRGSSCLEIPRRSWLKQKPRENIRI
jgi:hypothetical protein